MKYTAAAADKRVTVTPNVRAKFGNVCEMMLEPRLMNGVELWELGGGVERDCCNSG
jgi:hypothetical protein